MEAQQVIDVIKDNGNVVRFRHIVKALRVGPNDRQEAKSIDKILQDLRGDGKISYHNKYGWRLTG